MKEVIRLNNEWRFEKEYIDGMEKLKTLNESSVVNLPHANVEIDYNYFDERDFQIVSCY